MAFEPAQSKIPMTIGNIRHDITDCVGVDDEGAPLTPTVLFSIQVLDQNGKVMRIETGDEVPHMEQAQIDGQLAFIAAQRTKAVAEILG